MNMKNWLAGLSVIGVLVAAGGVSAAETVKVTPFGSHDGEFCAMDRALVFEDPNGTRILYDVGRTVAGPDDPRLGKIDVVLVSHVHGDHIGDRQIAAVNAGTCAKPETPVDATPNPNAVQIAVGKKAKIVTGSEMPRYFAGRLKAAGGNPEDSKLVRFGGNLEIGGVRITTVPAVHSNGLSPELVGGSLGEAMKETGVSVYVGPPTGYVLTFSNGLVVYLSGDTGITAEQDLVVRGHYGAKLAVLNIGDTYTTGPTEAAYVINELVKPVAVIASHANEAATQNGKLVSGTRTEAFRNAVKVPVFVPLSGKTMSFDQSGKCVQGC